MRKLWICRKAVSTMVGGVIVLGLFLTALVAMFFVTQQYDAYQATVANMAQKDIDRYSENLQVVFPGIRWPPSQVKCPPTGTKWCDQFVLNITNLANIGTQVARIYINSTPPLTHCTTLCVLDPSPAPRNSTFRASDRFINPLERNHLVILWLDSGILTDTAISSFVIVTTRGRVFAFQWPFVSVLGTSVPSGRLYLGCLSIHFNPPLIAYTSPGSTAPFYPIPEAWRFPYNTYLIIYIKVYNICTSRVLLLDRSAFTAIKYTGTGAGTMQAFYIASPNNVFPAFSGAIQAYNSSQQPYPVSCPCYVLPPADTPGQPSLPMYILFSADGIASAKANKFTTNNPNLYVGFLAMFWRCLDNTDRTCAQNYDFGITLPFITLTTFVGP